MISLAGTRALPDRRGSARPERRPLVDADRASERFREVVLPHLADCLAFANWLTGNRHDAEDVVQEACIKALNGIQGFDGRNARAWTLTIVRNCAFDWLAKHHPKAVISVGDLAALDEAAQSEGLAPGDSSNAESELIRQAESAAIGAAIADLPHVLREVLILRDVNGFSYKEIAAILSVPMGTVMSRLARARARVAATIVEAQ